MKIQYFKFPENFMKKAHDKCCCFVALLKAKHGKFAVRCVVFRPSPNDRNMQIYGIFNFYNLANSNHLQIAAKACNIFTFRILGTNENIAQTKALGQVWTEFGWCILTREVLI